jgi:hydroxypyruvate isomerase
MVELDVCLETVFPDLPYDQRIQETAKCGYKVVEFWFHDWTSGKGAGSVRKDAATLRQVCESTGVSITNMVVNAPDGSIGGSPVDAADFNKYIERLHEVIEFSQATGIDRAITCSGNLVPSLSRSQMRADLEKAYSAAADIASKSKYMLVVEPLNTYVDHAGYYLDSSSEAAEIVRSIDSPHFRLLYDVYHMQIMEGNLIANITRNIDIIGHFHSAGVPGRGEHFGGEVNYPGVLKAIEEAGYSGTFGLEYMPKMADHAESLRAVKAHLQPSP